MRDGDGRLVRAHLGDAAALLAGVGRNPGPEEILVETDCDGGPEVHVELILPSEQLVAIGQGGRDGVEDSLVRLGRGPDFEVVVVDPIPQLTAAADRMLPLSPPDRADFSIGDPDSVVALTNGGRDVPILADLARTPARDVSLLESRRRPDKDAAKLRAMGVAEELVPRPAPRLDRSRPRCEDSERDRPRDPRRDPRDEVRTDFPARAPDARPGPGAG